MQLLVTDDGEQKPHECDGGANTSNTAWKKQIMLTTHKIAVTNQKCKLHNKSAITCCSDKQTFATTNIY